MGIGDLSILISSIHAISKRITKPVTVLAQKNTRAHAILKHDPHIEEVIELDELRRSSQHTLDQELSELNQISKQIGKLFKSGKQKEANELKLKTGELKDSTKLHREKLSSYEKKLTQLLYQIPNIPNSLVKMGSSEKDNEIIADFGEVPSLHKGAAPHWDLAKEYKLIDFELGVKITGAGFPVYIGKGARLQRALINYFLNTAIESGYEEVIPPLLVNEDSGHGTGQLPDKEGQSIRLCSFHANNKNPIYHPVAVLVLS